MPLTEIILHHLTLPTSRLCRHDYDSHFANEGTIIGKDHLFKVMQLMEKKEIGSLLSGPRIHALKNKFHC